MKTIKIISVTLIIIAAYLLAVSCSGSSCCKNHKNDSGIPQEIIEKGNRFIISKTGKDFFDNYITPDLSNSQEIESGYFLSYKLIMPEKPYVNTQIKFSVDTSGNVIRNREIIGIPNCIRSTGDCEFNIDESASVEIAKLNNLEPGIKEWEKNFEWNSEHNKYVWRINNTLNETEGGYGRRANGKQILIDPNTGEVISLTEWRVN